MLAVRPRPIITMTTATEKEEIKTKRSVRDAMYAIFTSAPFVIVVVLLALTALSAVYINRATNLKMQAQTEQYENRLAAMQKKLDQADAANAAGLAAMQRQLD
eukprot:COSAG04_NODE_13246_length_614_cov_0.792233_1_plen_102_part_01